MKFRDVWHEIAKQNTILKIFLTVVIILCLFLAVIAIKSVEKPPLLIERSCDTRTINLDSRKHTIIEIENFLKVALAERFNTDLKVTDDYFTEQELTQRDTEHKALLDKGVTQYLIIRQIQQSENSALISADRILAFKEIRAATAINLSVTFAKVARTEKNPYGLIFTSIELKEKINESN